MSVQVQDVSRMHWGMNTDVDAVFDLILKVRPSSARCHSDVPAPSMGPGHKQCCVSCAGLCATEGPR